MDKSDKDQPKKKNIAVRMTVEQYNTLERFRQMYNEQQRSDITISELIRKICRHFFESENIEF